jgi:hypothetical protein
MSIEEDDEQGDLDQRTERVEPLTRGLRILDQEPVALAAP